MLKAKAMPLRSRARPITVLRTSSELYPPGEEGLGQEIRVGMDGETGRFRD